MISDAGSALPGVSFGALDDFRFVGLRHGDPEVVTLFPATATKAGHWLREIPPEPIEIEEVKTLAETASHKVATIRTRREEEQRSAEENRLRELNAQRRGSTGRPGDDYGERRQHVDGFVDEYHRPLRKRTDEAAAEAAITGD